MALDFDLTEEQHLLRQAVREFAEREIAPVAAALDEQEEFSVELTQKMGELGLLGCLVAEQYGGSHMGYVSYIIAVEELAASTPRKPPPSPRAIRWASARSTTTERRSRSRSGCRSCAAGEMLAAFGLTEPNAGSDAGGSQDHRGAQGRSLGHQRLEDLHHQRRQPADRGGHRPGRHRPHRQRQARAELPHRAA